jgi:hypothetical protein
VPPGPAEANPDSAPISVPEQTDLLKASIDTTLALMPIKLSENRSPQLQPFDLLVNNAEAVREPVAAEDDARVRESPTTSEQIGKTGKTAKSAQNKRKHRSTKASPTTSKRRASRSDKRGTVDPFAE